MSNNRIYKNIVENVLLTEAKELIKSSKRFEDEILNAVSLISKITGKLIVIGVGKSGLVGAKIAATFASTGTSSFFIHPTEAMHGDLGMILKGDAVLAISYSGESEELVKLLPHLKRFDIPLIAMSSNSKSTLGMYSNVFLNIEVTKEACPLNIAPTSSTTLTMALGDALAVCLMKHNNFKQEDFASFHPGGSLGKKLFVKVDDLLRTKNLPVVSCETILKEAILVMSKGRLGSAVVINENKEVLGILSDGDLRRALMSKNFSFNLEVIDICTKNPKMINNKYLLASDALKIVEDNKIQLLIITDENNKLLGLLHIHDLIEAGIK